MYMKLLHTLLIGILDIFFFFFLSKYFIRDREPLKHFKTFFFKFQT